jgi:outer membrane receptor protein involved in Fe transport
LPRQAVLDLRIEKTLRVGRGRLGVYADVTNVFNAGTPTDAQDRVPSNLIAGYDVLFGAPTAILPPRQATLGARWSF